MKSKKRVLIVERVAVNCPFCKQGFEPSYKNPDELRKYLSERAKIIGRSRSGLCSKHQRKLTIAIKRARHLGFLPFVASV
jgi:small subunit ribosomal protein S18